MRVTSEAGTDLTVRLAGSVVAGSTGLATEPGSIAHWPGGLVRRVPRREQRPTARSCWRRATSTSRSSATSSCPSRCAIEDDHVVEVVGDGVDAAPAALVPVGVRRRGAAPTSHLGWGMNPAARWDYLALYDKGDSQRHRGRACAGNFLYSTGANEHAGRFTAGHFDLPLLDYTIALDGRVVVDAGDARRRPRAVRAQSSNRPNRPRRSRHASALHGFISEPQRASR